MLCESFLLQSSHESTCCRLPPVPPLAKSQEEALQQEQERSATGGATLGQGNMFMTSNCAPSFCEVWICSDASEGPFASWRKVEKHSGLAPGFQKRGQLPRLWATCSLCGPGRVSLPIYLPFEGDQSQHPHMYDYKRWTFETNISRNMLLKIVESTFHSESPFDMSGCICGQLTTTTIIPEMADISDFKNFHPCVEQFEILKRQKNLATPISQQGPDGRCVISPDPLSGFGPGTSVRP